MLNDLNSSTNIPIPNTDNKKIENDLSNLKDQVNELENRIKAEENKTSETLTNLTTNGLNVEVSANIKSLVTDNATINDIQSSTIETSELDTQNITGETGTIKSLDSDNIKTKNATVTGTFQVNELQTSSLKTTNAEVSNLKSTDIVTENIETTGIQSVDAEIGSITSEDIETNNLKAEETETHSLKSQTIETSTITSEQEVTQDLKTDSLTSKDSDLTNITNKYIKGIGTINVDPNFQVNSDWLTIYIPNHYTNHEVMLHGHYTGDNGKQEWSITELGTQKTSMISWSQTNLEDIREISFDRETGNIAIKVKAEDYVDYHVTYLSSEIGEITSQLNGPGYETIYVPQVLQGYTFQSYNDDTTDFYFGGRVNLHSLKATVQEFDWATYKNIGIQENLRVVDGYDDDGNIIWKGGDEGQYLTIEKREYDGVEVRQLVWKDFANEVTENDDRPILSSTIATYNGTTSNGNYPITELGDDTTVHGKETVEGDFNSSHIYDVSDKDDYEIPDNSLVITDKINRKTTKDDESKYDEVAVYESSADLENNKPVIYNEENNSLLTSDNLSLDSLDTNNLNVANDAVIGGDLYVKGVTHTVDEETISSTSDNIVLRQNNDAPLAGGQLSGVVINNYDGNGKVSIIGSDNTGTIRVGDSDTEETSYDTIYLKEGKWYTKEDDEYTEITPEGELVSYSSKSINEENYTVFENAVFASFDSSNTVPLLAREEDRDLNDNALLKWNGKKYIAEDIAVPDKSEQVLSSSYDTTRKSVEYTMTEALNESGLFNLGIGEWLPAQSGLEIIINGAGYIVERVTYNSEENVYLVNNSAIVSPNQTVTLKYDETKLNYKWEDKKAGSFVFETLEDYNNSTENIPEGSLITILNEKNYLMGEDK